jgi:hypothetical protein
VKPVGRILFLFYALIIAAMWAALFPLLEIEFKMHGGSSLRFVAMFGGWVPGLWWLRCVDGRLLDAGLPRWYRWPYGFAWLFFACFCLTMNTRHGFMALLLFLIFQIPNVFLRSKPAAVESQPCGPSREAEKASRPEKPVGRFTFILIVVLFAALSVGLRPLEHGDWRVLDQIVYFILLPVWMISLESRLLGTGMPDWCFPPYAFILLLTLGLPWEFKAIDNTRAFMFFVLLQIPTVFLRTKPIGVVTSTQDRSQQEEAGNSSIS